MPLFFAKKLSTQELIHASDALIEPDAHKPACPFCNSSLLITHQPPQLPHFVHPNQGFCEILHEAEKLYPLLPGYWELILTPEEHQVLVNLYQALGDHQFYMNAVMHDNAAYLFKKVKKEDTPFYILESLIEKGGIGTCLPKNAPGSTLYELTPKALLYLGHPPLSAINDEIIDRQELLASLKMQSMIHSTNKPCYDDVLSFLKKVSDPLGNRSKRSPVRQQNRDVYHQTLHFLKGNGEPKPDLAQVLKPADDRSLGKPLVRKVYGSEGEFFLGHKPMSKTNVELLEEGTNGERYVLSELTSLFQSVVKNEPARWVQQKKTLDCQIRFLQWTENALPALSLTFLKDANPKNNHLHYVVPSYEQDPYTLCDKVSTYLGKKLKMFITYEHTPIELQPYLLNKYKKQVHTDKGIAVLEMQPKEFKQALYYAIGDLNHDIKAASHQSFTSKNAQYESRGRKTGTTNNEDAQSYLSKEKSIQILKALSAGMSLKMISFKKIGGYAIAKKVLVKFNEIVNDTAQETFVKKYRRKHQIKNLDFLKTNAKTIKKG